MKKAYIFATMLFIGCGIFEKEISGSVFIVTNSGENIKLGLIPVYFIPVKRFEQERITAIAEIEKFNIQNSEEFSILKRKYLNELNLFQSFELKNQENEKRLKQYILNQRTIGYTIWEHSGEVIADDFNQEEVQEICSQINKQIEEINSISEKMSQINERVANVSRKLKYICNASEKLKATRLKLFFNSIQTNAIFTTSNADGNFFIKIARGNDYIVSAFGERTVGRSKEKYYWLRKLNESSKNQEISILISNDSLINNIPGDESAISILNNFTFNDGMVAPSLKNKFKLKRF